MQAGIRVTGIDEAIARINSGIEEIEQLAAAGLWEAALQIIRAAQKRLQKSVVTGNLRASAYVRSDAQLERPDSQKLNANQNEAVPSDRLGPIGVELGFTAMYAIYAHENLEGNRAPKFLERVLLDNEAKIIEIVKRRSGGE